MWSSALQGKSPRDSDKSPVIAEDTWKLDDDGLVLCTEIFQETGSPSTISVRQVEYLSPHYQTPISSQFYQTPLSAHQQNYIIIPLRSPHHHGSIDNTMIQTSSSSSEIRSLYSVNLRSENAPQVYRRSPEKRLCSPGPICRICHEGDQEEELISPCKCSGSLALVHKSCLEKWLCASSSSECEICKFHLPTLRQTRPLWQWFGVTGATHGPQGFYADLTCILLLTPLCLISVYLCALGATEYIKHGIWEGTGLGILSFFLLSTYLLWFYVTVRYHWKTVKQWRSANQVIQLDIKYLKKRNNVMLSSLHQSSDGGSPINTAIPQISSPDNNLNEIHQNSPFTNYDQNFFPGSFILSESTERSHNPVYV